MSIAVRSPFRSSPRISRAKWHAVLDASGTYNSPLWNGIPFEDRRSVADALYDRIVSRGHDPAVWLSIGVAEHQLGTDDDSVLWRKDTRSWTNARTVRDPSLSGYTTVRDAKRGSNYVKYQTVTDSLLDGLYRVDEPGYAYRKANAVSIIDHTMIWTEGDGPQYAAKMVKLINEWMEEDTAMAAQIPGFTWLPADGRHHTRGRTQRIKGYAQHYTGGTDSRGWLTTSPNSDVSATFLIKHNPTMDDRGWQLVKIEDTPHTTGSVVNPFTVSCEYEQLDGQPIPDIAYQVMAQTIVDSAAYVKQHDLGEIPLNRTWIKGHKEWVGDNRVCPDGISVDHIVRIVGDIAGNQHMPPGDWPKVPPAVPDFHRTSNPYGRDFWVPKQFAVPMASEPFMHHGFVISPAFAETNADGETIIVQYTERRRYELHRDGSVTLGLVGREVFNARYPGGAP